MFANINTNNYRPRNNCEIVDCYKMNDDGQEWCVFIIYFLLFIKAFKSICQWDATLRAHYLFQKLIFN